MRSLVSVFRLVLFVAGFSFLRYSATAEIIELPDPYYTNQFTTVEAWVEINTEFAYYFDAEEWFDFYTNIVEQLSNIYNTLETIEIQSNVSLWTEDLEETFDSYASATHQTGRNWIAFKNMVFTYITNNISSIHQYAQLGESQVSRIQTIVDEIQDYHLREVISDVTFGQEYGHTLPGGGCECPDYTVYLSSLQSSLTSVRNHLDYFFSWVEDFRSGWQSVISSDYTSGALAASTLVKFFDWDWSVSVTNDVLVTNAPSNPLWVSITNNYPLPVWVTNMVEVEVSNFDGLVYMLTNSNTVEERSQLELDYAETQIRSLEEPGEEQDELESLSFDDFSELSGKLQDVVSSYKEMFDTNLMPDDPPSYVVIHNGFSLGPMTISSMHWHLPEHSTTVRLLGGIRSCFRAMWFVAYLVLLFYCAAVDMLVGGSLMACCFGVLMGDASKITTGIWRCWRLFCRMLGISDFD